MQHCLYVCRAVPRSVGAITICWAALLGLSAAAQTGTFLDKPNASDIRVVSYNLGGFNDGFSDQPFDFVNGFWQFDDNYARVVDALDADVWAFQEIAQRTATQIRIAMNLASPLPDGESWNVFRQSNQVIASRYDFVDTFAQIGGSPRSPAVATVDLPDALTPTDLHIVNMHLKAGGSSNDESQRIDAIDRVQAYFRDAQQPGDPDELVSGTASVFLGDYNTAAGINPVLNLVRGDIQNESTYGSDQPLDWDGTELSAVNARHNVTRSENWTFGSSSFRSRLDYHVYTDSVMSLSQAFILNTTVMSSADLAATGLQSGDVFYDSGFFDHLPVVADYSFPTRVIPEPGVVGLLLVGWGVATRRRGRGLLTMAA